MSPSSGETTSAVSVVCVLSLEQLAPDFKSLEAQIIATVEESGRQFYAQVVRAFQERWLEQNGRAWSAVRWRTIDQITPFGALRLPVRVVRRRSDGRYRTLSKVLLAPKATRLLSPEMEKRALEAARGCNYRPTAAELSRWVRNQISAWLIWRRCARVPCARVARRSSIPSLAIC